MLKVRLSQGNEKKTNEYFSFWKLQNKITLFSLLAILVVSALFVAANIVLPEVSTAQTIAFIVSIPALACLGIGTSHSSNLESAKVQREFQRLQKRLSETEDSQLTLDRFFSISSDLMAVAGKDGLLKKVSASLVNTLGYSESVLLSTPFFEFIHPDDREATMENIKSLNSGIRSVGFENRYQAADGTYRTLSWSAAADQELGVRFASARDITDERNFRIRMQQIMDSAPYLMLVKDIDGTISHCNASVMSSLASSHNIVVGQSVDKFKSSHFVASLLEKETEVLRSKMAMTFDEVLLRQNKEERHLSTVFPIFGQEGNIVSIGKVSLNISFMSGKLM